MKRNTLRTLLIAVACLGLAAVASADTSKPKVVGLLFYADWCGSCKVLEPKLDAVKKDFAGQPILFTRVDMTDDLTKEQSALLASQLGFSGIYAENAPKTGFMLLIDSANGRVVSKLTKTQNEAFARQRGSIQ
ncbi:MAG: thioredoxin family protein [Opitutaceae bacterium]